MACASVFFSFGSLFAVKMVSPLLWATGGALAAAALVRSRGEPESGEGCMVVAFAIISLVICGVAAVISAMAS